MRIQNHVLAVFLLHLVTSALGDNDTRSCYDVDNKIMLDHRPCVNPTTQEHSHCCSLADTCIGDTLCLSQFGTLYVGGCTAKDWSNGRNARSFCPKYCNSVGSDIGVCSNSGGHWEFCCGALGGHENCCAEKYGKRFQITGNTTSTALIQRPWNDTSSTTLASASAAVPSSSMHCPAPEENNNPPIALSVGLGIPLLIALGLLLWENRKRKHVEGMLAQYTGPLQHDKYVPVDFVQLGTAYNPSGYACEADALKATRNELPPTTQVHELANPERASRTN